MPRVPVQMGPSSEAARSKQGGGTTLVNCYAEKTEGGKSQYSLNTDPGFILFSSISTAGLRGIFAFENNFYVLAGEKLYSVSSAGVATQIGVVLGSAPVIFSINRKSPNNQITITADTKNYYVENNVLAEITDPDLPGGIHSNCHLNGMTVYGQNDGRLFWSDDNSTQNINALNFTEAELSADKGRRVFTNGSEVWYWGFESLEIFSDTGSVTLRLEPNQSVAQGKGAGCVAKNSVAILDSTVFWVSDARLVVRGNPYVPLRVSNHAVERDIERAIAADYNNEMVGFAWEQQGHQFYHLRCPLWCWVYDASNQTWHKKQSYGETTWDGAFYAFAYGKHLIGSAVTGKVYEYTFAANDEDGSPLVTKILTSVVHDFPNGLICDALYIDIQSGTGRPTTAAHAVDPQINLRVSRDGGETFGTEYQQPLGQQGAWQTNIRFNRLGHCRGGGMVFEIASPEAVERAVFQAFADVRRLKA
jgi:hypothetical protein